MLVRGCKLCNGWATTGHCLPAPHHSPTTAVHNALHQCVLRKKLLSPNSLVLIDGGNQGIAICSIFYTSFPHFAQKLKGNRAVENVEQKCSKRQKRHESKRKEAEMTLWCKVNPSAPEGNKHKRQHMRRLSNHRAPHSTCVCVYVCVNF